MANDIYESNSSAAVGIVSGQSLRKSMWEWPICAFTSTWIIAALLLPGSLLRRSIHRFLCNVPFPLSWGFQLCFFFRISCCHFLCFIRIRSSAYIRPFTRLINYEIRIMCGVSTCPLNTCNRFKIWNLYLLPLLLYLFMMFCPYYNLLGKFCPATIRVTTKACLHLVSTYCTRFYGA